jgi:hypothetical protein
MTHYLSTSYVPIGCGKIVTLCLAHCLKYLAFSVNTKIVCACFLMLQLINEQNYFEKELFACDC